MWLAFKLALFKFLRTKAVTALSIS